MSGMRNIFSMFSGFLTVSLVLFGLIAQTDAQGSRRNDRDTRDIVRSLKSKIDDFQYNLTYQMKNNSADQDEVTTIDGDLRELTGRLNDFEDNLDKKRENRDDVTGILDAAQKIGDYLNQNPQNRKFQSDWTSIRSFLDRLAVNYNIPTSRSSGGYNNQNTGNYPGGNNYPNDRNYPVRNNRGPVIRNSDTSGSNSYGLTGTYQLDQAQSENINDVIADGNVSGDDQRRAIQSVLESPEQIALDVRGSQVTLSSTAGSPATYTADGRDMQQTVNNQSVRTRATLRSQELTLSTDAGSTNSSVTFVSADNGQTLKVTRRLTTDYLNQTLIIDSVYRKTDSVARLGVGGDSNNSNNSNNYPDNSGNGSGNGDYSSSDSTDRNNPNNNYPRGNAPTTSTRTGNFVVPNGTIIMGNLDNDIDTKLSQNNDRFKMTVQSPDEYRGATIEGYITGVSRSGKVSGRSQVTLNFERITLRNGQAYDFAGYLQGITDQNGKTVKIDAEGTAQGGDQTKETVKRGGIGGGIGAVIGAIAGGVKGAAIGAVIGGGAGAGSVIAQGKDDLEIRQGSSITVQSSSPAR